jgi:hypothetical protein
MTTEGSHATGVGLYQPCHVSDTPEDGEGETAKVRQGGFVMGPRPLFIMLLPDTDRIKGLFGALTELEQHIVMEVVGVN